MLRGDLVSYTGYGAKVVGMVAVRIKSVPDYQLFSENDEDAISLVKQTFATLISEISHIGADGSASLELMLKCVPTVNQPFRSFILATLVIRCVSDTQSGAYLMLDRITSDTLGALGGIKTVAEVISPDDYIAVAQKMGEKCVIAVRRPDEYMGFQVAMFPCCYKYDAVNPFFSDLDPIVNALISETDVSVILQLTPTRLTDAENMYISNCTNALARIGMGIPIPRMGFYKDVRAEIPHRTYEKYYESANMPLLAMNMLVIGSQQSAERVAPKLMSMLSSAEGQNTALEAIFAPLSQSLAAAHVSPWLVHEALLQYNRAPFLGSVGGAAAYRLSSLYTPHETSQIFRLPIGTKKVTAGITIHEVEKRNKKFAEGIINVADISIGKLQNVISADDSYIGINKNSLTKHMLVVGTPGSGKSTFLVGMMDRLWKKLGIPFLVIEPAKNEYRALIDSIPELQVFSPGKNNVAPFVMNPFVPPSGVTVEKYKSIVKSAFSAAFEMWTPLDQLFDETLNICYSEQGWLDSTVVTDAKECFSLIDFIKVYKEVVGSKGYSGEYKKQIEAAGVLRLNGLLEQNVNIFDTRYSVPVQDILERPTVIELSNIKDLKQKSFIIAMLLNNIYAYVEANNKNDGKLKNVILLEEAHALLTGDSAGGQGDGQSSNAAAVKLLADMLAEIRSRGVGIVVADQSPKKVTAAVIANTNVKVLFRLVEADDKEIVKRSTVMTDIQRERLSKLDCGAALLFFDKLDEVEEVKMDDYRLNNGISTDLSDDAIKAKMTYWQSHAELMKPYRDCDFIGVCSGGCNVLSRERARVITERIFRKNYPRSFNSFETFLAFYKKINYVIRDEVTAVFGDPAIAPEIAHCVKVQLLRKVHYQTEIEIDLAKRCTAYKPMQKSAEQ